MQHITPRWIAAAITMCLISVPSTMVYAEADLKITDGLTVAIEYTLTLNDKSVADTNVGGEPLSYVHGKHEILPSLENRLVGLHVGQSKTIEISAAEAYGVYNDKAIITVEKNQIPLDAKIGSILTTQEGQPVRVLELTEDIAKVDFNHPLAGQDLTFDVKILRVDPPKPTPR